MTDSIAKQCLDAIVYSIQGLNLTGLESAEITGRKIPRDQMQARRGVTVAPAADVEGGGTNERDDIGYGYVILCCQGTGRGDTDDIDRVTEWRQAIKRKFHNKRLVGSGGTITEIYICSVGSGEKFVPKELRKHQDVSVQLIRCWSREPRT